jgi:hypothetical protein
LGSIGGEKRFYLGYEESEGAIDAGSKDKDTQKQYSKTVSAFLAAQFAKVSFPGCIVTDKVTSKGGDSTALDIGECWESVLKIDWIRATLIDAPVSISSQLCGEEAWYFTPDCYQYWSHVLEKIYPDTERSDGEFGFNWYGFPKVEPDWIEMGSLVARLTSERGPIPIRLGDILVPPNGVSRGQLSAVRVDEGILLNVKSGGRNLLAMLSEHFDVPWVQGVSPVPVPKRLDWTPIPSPPDEKPPVSFRKAPPFFKKVVSKNGSDDSLSSEKFLQMLGQSEMFEGYNAESRKQAEEMVDASYRRAGDWQAQLISAIGFWREADEASGYLEEVLAELRGNSFGIFSPADLNIEFDDEELPPEGDVHISYTLNSKPYKLTAEYFHGSIPGELLPFIKESMEKSCSGVAWRQIFPEAKDTKALYYTLCTAAALDRIKVNAAMML